MSLIADALKKVQSSRLARRYHTSEPSGVLPVAVRNERTVGRLPFGSILSGSNLSTTLGVGLGSGIILFLVLFAYFFYGPGQKVKSPSAASAVEKRPVELILSAPPAVQGVEALQFKEGAVLGQAPRSLTGGERSVSAPVRPTGEVARARLNGEESEPKSKAMAKEVRGKGESSKVSVTSDLSEEVRHGFNLALSYQEEKNFLQARSEYERVIQMWPLYPEAYNNLGLVYKELRMYNQAIAHLEKALALNPDYIRAYHNLGVIYQLKGDLKRAMRNYQKALSLDRNHLSSLNNLGLIYREKQQLHEARGVLEKALAIDPASSQTQYNLALVLEGLGEVERARFHYRKFVELAGEENRPLAERVEGHLRGIVREGK